MKSFEHDEYPGQPRILFVGIGNSTHTHAWIDLLKDEPFNTRLFSTTDSLPPEHWKVRTYTTRYNPPAQDPDVRMGLFDKGKASRFANRSLARIRRRPWDVSGLAPAWLAEIIKSWQPHVIHTLGLDAAVFFLHAREKFGVGAIGKWVLQTRGGSDLTLTHQDPQRVEDIRYVLRACDQLVSDNLENFRIARELGVAETQLASITPVPGTGGIEVDKLSAVRQLPPSGRRMILWPKAYETPWGKVLPVFEALKMCWERIQPTEVQMLSTDGEARMWYWTLPEHIRRSCHLNERLSRARTLEMMCESRVMLAPSLVDGVPNSLYEAMACGAFPIVSPLETITPVVENERNVLFARNLYPDEIAAALQRAMSEDSLVDAVADRNLELVRRVADRSKIRSRVVEYYERLAK